MSIIRSVPFFNYRALYEAHKEEYKKAFEEVCTRGAFILQSDLEEFEDSMRVFLDAKYCWGVADGTNALILGLQAMGIGAGDEVIVPSHTYVASAAAVKLVGATPVLADCGKDHLIDIDSARKLVNEKTKAIMPVHLNGRTCNMSEISGLADEKGLMIIEDAAQALGSKYKGKSAGTFGSVGTISFYPAKVLGCFGDGGLVISNDDFIGKRLSLLRDHGRSIDGEIEGWGTNSRLDNLQAAILNVSFRYFSATVKRRRELASIYHESLSSMPQLALPPEPSEGDHFDVYQNYELQCDKRDELKMFLADNGVGTIIQWGGKAVHQIEALGFKEISLPRTEDLFKKCLLLPMNPSLSNEDVKYVADLIKRFYE